MSPRLRFVVRRTAIMLPVLAAMPPLDVAWRVVAWPFRALLQRDDPVFLPKEAVPPRFVGATVGAAVRRTQCSRTWPRAQ